MDSELWSAAFGSRKRQFFCLALISPLMLAAIFAWAFSGFSQPKCVRANNNPAAGCLGKVNFRDLDNTHQSLQTLIKYQTLLPRPPIQRNAGLVMK